jgi:hypothetical protein
MVGVSSGGWGLRVRVNRQRSTHWHVYSLANAPEHRNHRTPFPIIPYCTTEGKSQKRVV